MIDISQIKSRITCVEFAQKNNININRSGDRCVSPLRPGATNKTSFVVYDDFFFDFGSGEGGDVIDFAAKLLFGDDKGKAIRHLAKITGVDLESAPTDLWVKYTQNLCKGTNDCDCWRHYLPVRSRSSEQGSCYCTS